MKIGLVAFNGRYIHSCLALYYVREELRHNLPGALVEMRQFTINDPYYPTLLAISGVRPDVLMISTYIWNSTLVLRLATDLAKVLPETRFVFGGPQAAALAESPLPPRTTLVHGEVEGLPASFYADLRDGRLAPEYLGETGHAFPSPLRDEDLTGELTNRHVYYESTRGCPFACSYCLSSVFRGMTWKDVGQVKAELAAILAHRPRIIKFVDRTFNARPDRALAIWRFLAGAAGETVCHFEMAPDHFTEEMFELLASLPPGRFQFELGIQSTDPQTLARISRPMDLDRAGANIRRLAALGNIHLHVDLILGLPGETGDGFLDSFRRVFAMAPHYIQMGLLKVLPGTAMSRDSGLVHCRQPPYEVLATDGLDHATLGHLHRLCECVEAFHNNRYFPTFFSCLRERGEGIARFFEDLLALCRTRNFFAGAATHPALAGLLAEQVRTRPDGDLLLELLRHDWLRCGHRFLPPEMGESDLAGQARTLARSLPPNLPPFFDYRGRDEFLKRNVFSRFSGEALALLGYPGHARGATLAFLAEREPSLFRHQRTIVIPE